MMRLMLKSKNAGVILTVLVAAIPIVLWVIFSPSHSDPLAKMTALSALSLLSFTIILSARLRWLEHLFFGLDRVYRAHRMISAIIIMLLLAHSSLLTLKYLQISKVSAFEFVVPSNEWALLAGKLGLYTLVTLVVVTLYFKVQHQWFVRSMRALGLVIFLAGYHALFVNGSDILKNAPLAIYMVVLGGAAAAVYVYRSLFHGRLNKAYSYQVEKVTSRGLVTDIWLRPAGQALNRYAGQFAFIEFVSQSVSDEPHPFTIAAGSNEERLRFCIKQLGDFTRTLPTLKVGDLATVEGPYGFFSFTKIVSKKQTWVAGGIGITPFLAMAHSLPSGYDITLYYCVSKQEDAVFLDELQQISKNLPTFKVIPFVSETQGQISGEIIAKTNAQDYLLCGPPGMMKAITEQLVAKSVAKHNIHFEEFAL